MSKHGSVTSDGRGTMSILLQEKQANKQTKQYQVSVLGRDELFK